MSRERIAVFCAGFFLAGFLCGAGLTAQAVANAEPGVGDIVCAQSKLGYTPGEIAEQLHEGDPRYSIWDTGQTVWYDLQACQ